MKNYEFTFGNGAQWWGTDEELKKYFFEEEIKEMQGIASKKEISKEEVERIREKLFDGMDYII